jgi:hypothetical protein
MNFDAIRSLRWVDYVYCAIIDPRSLARLIKQKGSGFIPAMFIIPVVVAVSDVVVTSLLTKQTGFFVYKMSYGWILSSIMTIVGVFFIAAVIDIALQLSGSRGSFPRLVSLVSVAYFPKLVMVPFVSIFVTFGFAPVFFYVLSSMAIGIFCVIIVIRGVAELHEISIGRAIAVVIVPFAIIGILIFLALILLFALVFGALQYGLF